MSHDKLRADWREFSDEKIKSFPPVRAQAKQLKSKYYFNGKPCAQAHLTIRYTASASCVICHADREKARTKKAKSTFVSKNKAMAPMLVLGIRINQSLSSNTD